MSSSRATIHITLALFLILYIEIAVFALTAKAATTDLPSMLVGSTNIIVNQNNSLLTYYNPPQGNYAVYNPDTSASYGFDNTVTGIQNCANVSRMVACFILGTGLSGTNVAPSGKLLTSQTSVTTSSGTKIVYELPALYFGGMEIMGDIYTGSGGLNFAQWGRNLAESSGSVSTTGGSTWSLGNYTQNSASRGTWLDSNGNPTPTFTDFSSKIADLSNGGVVTDSTTLSTAGSWYLQGQGSALLTDVTQADAVKYPEGKVWVLVGNLTIPANTAITYSGTGTIIVKGNLTIGSSTTISPSNTTSRLGIIALGTPSTNGDITLSGSNTITALMMASNNFNISGSNIKISGAVAAYNIIGANNANLQFTYDYTSDDKQPPGFRYLNIPQSKETGNR